MSRFRLIKALLGPLLRVLLRPQVEGAERIPGSGPVILAGNHLTFIDSMVLPLVTDRQVFFIGKDEYVSGRSIKGRLMAWFFTGVGMIPVDRDGGRGGVAALMTGPPRAGGGSHLRHLPGGHPLPRRPALPRPYGHRPPRADDRRPRGAVRDDRHRRDPAGRQGPAAARAGRRIAVRFGEPLDFTRYEGMDRDRYVLRAVTDEVMSEVMRLSGQEYVDIYATKAKAAA